MLNIEAGFEWLPVPKSFVSGGEWSSWAMSTSSIAGLRLIFKGTLEPWCEGERPGLD